MYKCSGTGITVRDVSTNSGVISIDSSGRGLYFNQDDVEFINSGTISISGCSSNAISVANAVDCKLINQSVGSITIFDSEEIAIVGLNLSDLEITNSGIIDISNIEQRAISSDKVSLINEETGEFSIEDAEFGFWASSSSEDVLNKGLIKIKDIVNRGFDDVNVENTATGIIELENVGDVGIDGDVVNAGTIILTDVITGAGITGDVANSGTISMTNIGTTGITIGDVFNTGQVVISSFGNTGINIRDTLVNSGTISLQGGTFGIYDFGGFSSDNFISNDGQITIEDASNAALFISDVEFEQGVSGSLIIENCDVGIELNNQATFENSGNITINSTTTNAIEMQECNLHNNIQEELNINAANVGIRGSFTNDSIWNDGTIAISNTVLQGIIFNVGQGVLENSSSGTMNFVEIGRDAAIVAEIENAGSLTVSDGCQWNAIEGDVTNSGSISFSLLGGRGIEGAFTNSGTVVFDTLGSDGFRVLDGKSFNNSGTITLTSVPNTTIFVSGAGSSWTNSGDITITGGIGNALHLTEAGLSSQTVDGTLDISGKNIGILVSDCGFFDNGTTTISNSALGVSTSTDADFSVEASCILTITDCTRGFLALSGSISENSGSITMAGLISIEGLIVRTGAQFANFGSGVLTIDRAGMTAVLVDDASLINLGEINLTSDITAIQNIGDFENRPTGLLKILESGNIGLTNGAGGVFSNQGTLDITTDTGVVDIQNLNGGSLVNTGTIIVRE